TAEGAFETMKLARLSVLFLPLMAASASIVPCPSITNLSVLLTIASGAGNGCQEQDKIFSNFAYSDSTNAANINATVVFVSSGPTTQIHGWVFSRTGSWTSGFTLSYDIAVAPGNPTVSIFQAKDQINSGATPNGTVINDTQTPNVGPAFPI